jgi:hypothetical protein
VTIKGYKLYQPYEGTLLVIDAQRRMGDTNPIKFSYSTQLVRKKILQNDNFLLGKPFGKA